jgi:hypothetical protein
VGGLVPPERLPLMATLRTTTADLLRADATLATLLPGGIHEYPLTNEWGVKEAEGATPAAFDQQTGKLKPSAVVSIFGVGQSFAGTSLISQLGGRPPIQSRAAVISFYQPRPFRDAIESAARRAEDVLDGRQLVTDDLGVVVLTATGNLGDNPGDDDLNAELERLNLRITSMRRNR